MSGESNSYGFVTRAGRGLPNEAARHEKSDEKISALIAEARRWTTPAVRAHVSHELLDTLDALADALEASVQSPAVQARQRPLNEYIAGPLGEAIRSRAQQVREGN